MTTCLLILSPAACTDVRSVGEGGDDIPAEGWGVTDPNASAQPPGAGSDDEGDEGWSTIDNAPGDEPSNGTPDEEDEGGAGADDPTAPTTEEGAQAICGDGACVAGEDCLSCPEDCGQTCPPGTCGDNICDGDNTCESCPEDCGQCGDASCGNGACDNGRAVDRAIDCGSCPEVVCGDGVCSVGEARLRRRLRCLPGSVWRWGL